MALPLESILLINISFATHYKRCMDKRRYESKISLIISPPGMRLFQVTLPSLLAP